MRAIFRTSFRIKNQGDSRATAVEVAESALDWVFHPKRTAIRSGATRPSDPLAPLSGSDLGGDHLLDCLTVDDEKGSVSWGLRLTHPDREDPALQWRTELSLSSKGGHYSTFSCSLLLGRSDGTYAPFRREPSCPRIVYEILNQFETATILPLRPKPIAVAAHEDEVKLLVKFLESPSRTHPIVFISTYGFEQINALEVKELAKQLGGLAHVIVARENAVSDLMSKQLPPAAGCFDGGIRIYWPGFSRNSNPYHHPLIIRPRLEQMLGRHPMSVGRFLLRKLAEVAVFNVGEEFLTWARLQSIQRAKEIEVAREKGELEELLLEENRDLRAELELTSEELRRKAADSSKAQEESARWKDLYLQLCRSNEVDPNTTEQLPVGTVALAIAQAEADLSDKIVFELNSKSDRTSPFEEADEVLDALLWLATTYWDAKVGRSPGTRLDHTLREAIPGWTYAGGQSDITMKSYPDWYRCFHKGRHFWVGEHIGTGSIKDPRHSIRIGFCWLGDEKKVLVGYIGQHQRTSAT